MKQTIVIMILAALVLVGCRTQTTNNYVIENQNNKLAVVTTLFPLYEFAREVGGNNVEVTLLLPPGAEPHSFEPKPSDIQKIENADVFIYIGEVMEPWAHDILEGTHNADLMVIDSSSLVTLLAGDHDHEHEEEHDEEAEEEHIEEHEEEHHHENGAFDPHIWLDLENDQKIVDEVAKIFSKIDSKNADYYMQNADNYKQKLHSLDEKYLSELQGCKKDEFLVGGHNFFGYIEHRYNVEGISAIENLEPNTEPTPKRIQEIAEVAKEHDIKYILTEVLVSQRMSEAIAEEVGATVLTFNPAPNLPKSDFDNGVTFISVMEDNLQTLKTALVCD